MEVVLWNGWYEIECQLLGWNDDLAGGSWILPLLIVHYQVVTLMAPGNRNLTQS